MKYFKLAKNENYRFGLNHKIFIALIVPGDRNGSGNEKER